MLVTTAPGMGDLLVNDGRVFISLKAGEKRQLFGNTLTTLLQKGLVVKAEYADFQNNETVVVEHKEETGWRPIVRKKK